MSQTRPPKLASEIVGYYLRNRLAVDTLEGVARWRLPDQQIHRTLVDVDTALRWLVEAGLLTEHHRVGSAPLFALNPDRIEEAHKLVEEDRQRTRKDGATDQVKDS